MKKLDADQCRQANKRIQYTKNANCKSAVSGRMIIDKGNHELQIGSEIGLHFSDESVINLNYTRRKSKLAIINIWVSWNQQRKYKHKHKYLAKKDKLFLIEFLIRVTNGRFGVSRRSPSDDSFPLVYVVSDSGSVVFDILVKFKGLHSEILHPCRFSSTSRKRESYLSEGKSGERWFMGDKISGKALRACTRQGSASTATAAHLNPRVKSTKVRVVWPFRYLMKVMKE